jgi:hypothetical protein
MSGRFTTEATECAEKSLGGFFSVISVTSVVHLFLAALGEVEREEGE